MKTIFPERLRLTRKERNLTQKALAEMLGVATGTVTMWEIGKREPGIDKLCAIADALGVSTDYLVGCSDEKNTMTVTRSTPAEFPVCTAKEAEFLMMYLSLDSYGKASVGSLIRAELLRCHEQGTASAATRHQSD